MIIKAEGQRVSLSPETEDFIKKLTERTGTPANEVIAAIINGQVRGSW